jgi:hypothetical protein
VDEGNRGGRDLGCGGSTWGSWKSMEETGERPGKQMGRASRVSLIQRFTVNYFQDLTARKCDDLATVLDRLHVQRSLEPGFTYIVIVDKHLVAHITIFFSSPQRK